MRDDSHEDPWLLPTHQAALPTRETLPESRLHGRREATFLFLSALFLVAAIVPIALGGGALIDLGYTLSRIVPDREPLMALGLPVGALLVPLGLAAVQLVCEVYGRRRAGAMVWIGFAAVLVTLGVLRVAAELDAASFAAATAFAAFYLVANVINLSVFDAMRRSMSGRALAVRTLTASVIAPLFASAALGGVLYAYGTPFDAIAPIVAGLAVYGIASALLGVVPVILAARVLVTYLRVGHGARATARAHAAARRPRLAQGTVSERRDARRLANVSGVQPFNSAEMRFFTEGDELASAE